MAQTLMTHLPWAGYLELIPVSPLSKGISGSKLGWANIMVQWPMSYSLLFFFFFQNFYGPLENLMGPWGKNEWTQESLMPS